jgi:O-antigen/teichoic acid export membrane protein
MNLRLSTFSAVRWTAIGAITGAVLRVGQIAILARLLAPADYGLMAMVGVVLGFAGLFSDLGVNSAYVHRQQVTQEQRSSLFWFNVAVSAGLTGLVIALSPVFAWFFGDERLRPLIMIAASTCIINALGQQVRVAAEKELDFQRVVLLEVVAAILGFFSAVLAAISGWGVYSLILGGVVSASTSTLLAWSYVSRGWRPTMRLRIEDLRPFLGFGAATVVNGIVNHINLTIDLFLGGRLLSSAQLGYYSVPRNLVLQLQFIINPIITRVGFPLIAQVQSDPTAVRNIYLKTVNMTSSTNAPIYIFLAIFSSDVVTLLLGPGWSDSASLLRVLAIWGFVRSTGNPVGSLLLGMGRPRLALQWNTALLLVIPPVLWIGSQYGPNGLAWGLLLLAIVLFVPSWLILVRPLCHANLSDYSVAALRPLLLASLSVVPAYILVGNIELPVVRLIAGVVVATMAYFAISYRANRDWFIAIMELLKRRRYPGVA